jgi:hypothetical protein
MSMARLLFTSLIRQYGSKEMAAVEGRNIVKRLLFWRSTLPEVDLFAMFLEDAFCVDDVDVYLYIEDGALLHRASANSVVFARSLQAVYAYVWVR